MTVQAAVLMWSNQSLNESTKGLTTTITINETWQVICDTTDRPEDILSAPGLPQKYQPYPATAQIIVEKRQPDRISPILFHVNITYKGEIGPEFNDSPVNRAADVSWSSVETEEEIDEDINGKAIATANGEPIHGVTTRINDLQARITKNYLSVNLGATIQYLRSTNSDPVDTGDGVFLPGTGRLTAFDATRKSYASGTGQVRYYEVNAIMLFRTPYRTTPDKAWYARVRHEGFKVKLIGFNAEEIKRATDPHTQQESNTPVLLKPNGEPLPVGADAHWLEFPRYNPLPYSNLGLFT